MELFDQLDALKENKEEDTSEKSNTVVQCSNCNQQEESQFIWQDAKLVCSNCGYVTTQVISSDPEWRFYGEKKQRFTNPSRCGFPPNELFPKSSFTVRMDSKSAKYKCLVRLQQWNCIHPEERSLYTVCREMDRIMKQLNVSKSIQFDSKKYYKLLTAKDHRKGSLTRGSVRKSFIAACIYISAENHNAPIQKKKIAQLCGIDIRGMTKGFKKFCLLEKNKNIRLRKNNKQAVPNLIRKFSNELEFTKFMKDLSFIIHERVIDLGLVAHNNKISVAAGILRFVSVICEADVSKSELLEVIDTSTVTIQKIFKILNKNKQYLLIGLEEHIKSN